MSVVTSAVKTSVPRRGRAPEDSARSFLLYVALPAWIAPSLLDWWYHRTTRIEDPANGGTAESALHALMLVEAGAPLVLGTVFEINPLLVALMGTTACAHELTAVVDVWLAKQSDRRVTQAEQHVHSFLEVMPFWMIPLTILVHRPMAKGLRLRLRRPRLSGKDLGLIGVLVLLGAVLPYGEEMVRCRKNLRNDTIELPKRSLPRPVRSDT